MALSILLLPLISAVVSGAFSLSPNKKILHIISAALLAVSAFYSVDEFLNFYANPEAETQIITLFRWFDISDFELFWELRFDMLSLAMCVIVTTVSAVVHCYSIGYMYDDANVNRFISYLSLFTFFMLVLVTGNNLLQLFVGWEGVGVCSYLLIGFWYKKDSANKAAMKAFLANRVGDLAFIIGMLTIFFVVGSIEFSEIFAYFSNYQANNINLYFFEMPDIDFICLMLFIGCMGKSAQLGLHVWLPDAMEGPTPVSALIHAATMVTAGVYLVVRTSLLFELSPFVLELMTIIGALTCIFAASVGLVQNDIKRVIAYSTCSQLGYMFFACGVSAYSAAMFHLLTHAFFKALLFLTAGNVIVALHHEQDIRKMGGLARKMPYTYILVWIGSVAIAGIPPLAGYYSKDIILEMAYLAHSSAGSLAFAAGLIAAIFTSFYSWRLLYLTFHGKTRNDYVKKNKVTKISPWMSLPLIVLALGALGSGYIGAEKMNILDNELFWKGAIVSNSSLDDHHHLPPIIKLLPLFAALAGLIAATSLYLQKNLGAARSIANAFPKLYSFLLNKYYIDELYHFAIISPYRKFSKFSWKFIDDKIIDGLIPRGGPRLIASIAKKLIRFQSGYIYRYAFVVLGGVILFSSWFFYKIFYF